MISADSVRKAYIDFISSVLPFQFRYEYTDGTIAVLKFKEHDIIHQLGLDRLTKYKIMKDKKMPGVAKKAYHDLRKGKITTHAIMKDPQKGIILSKVNEYRFISALLGDTKTAHYSFDHTIVPCSIKATYLLYDHQKNTHFHFGTVTDQGNDVSPMTWFVENNKPDKYIKNQQQLIVKRIIISER